MDSLVKQTLPKEEYEIIVVDDCSTDGTFDVLNGYAEQYRNVKLLRGAVNSHSGGARNLGLVHSGGEWIMFVDADDWLDLDACEKLLVFAEQSEADVIGFGFRTVESYDAAEYERSIPFSGSLIGAIDSVEKRRAIFSSYSGPVFKLYRRKVLVNGNNVYACFPEMTAYEDFAVMGDIMLMNCRYFDIFPQYLYHYYVDPKSTSHSLSEIKAEDARRAIRIKIKLAKTHGYFEEMYDVICDAAFWLSWTYAFQAVFGSMSLSRGMKYCRGAYRELCLHFPDYRSSPGYEASVSAAGKEFFDALAASDAEFRRVYLKWYLLGHARNSAGLNRIYRNSDTLKRFYRRTVAKKI